jgi:site-specific DNA-methyltransferase (adenine-specific)/adenine-specific DNA-methyltransferase
MELTEKERQYLIERLKDGETIPPDFKYKLFPTGQKEYELSYAGKMRREDILANEDGVFPVPLQIEKVFNGERENFDDGWRNMIVFGDNLQFLKTIYHNQDELIKDKVKGKVKLIYIDPPFGTGDEYDGNKGQKAYSAKTKGADFVEFLRRRLIVAREVLARDGVLFIRIDYHFGHYVKVLMDQIFGKDNFRNEIVINRFKRQLTGLNQFNHSVDSLFFYSKSENYNFTEIFRSRICSFCGSEKEPEWHHMVSSGLRNPPERTILGRLMYPPKGQHWKYTQEKIDQMTKDGRIRIVENRRYTDINGDKVQGVPDFLQTEIIPVDNSWTDLKGYLFNPSYPTENPEELLERVIKCSTVPGDLVLDFFAGSGVTAAVSEKMGRKWIVCDIGKLSFYTMQKRLLQIQDSKWAGKKYGQKAKAFLTVNTGLYDLQKLWELNQEKYKDFVLNLFEVERRSKKIGGIKIDGERFGSYVMVWPFWEHKDASVDETFLATLHQSISGRIGDRFYVIAPANSVDFISDYHEIGDVRYYFLKVPYQIIQELHKKQFKKFRQPQSKSKINELEDAIGFHFMRQPEVQSHFEKGNLTISKFVSSYSDEDTGREMANFESLSMVIVDENYNGKEFVMTQFFFAEDLLKTKKKDQTEEELKNELKHQKRISIPLKPLVERIFVIYVDIYGNEFKEEMRTK